MSTIFCCSTISPYRQQRLDHEAKFEAFMQWAGLQTTSLVQGKSSSLVSNAPYAVQLVRQINYGPQESIRYFVPASNSSDFTEAIEEDLLKLNFEKLNSYKNFRCEKHNKFFEVNLYQRNPSNAHHWRVNLARPSRDIDLAFQRKDVDVVEETSGQEKKPELLPSDIQDEAYFQKWHSSLSPTLKEADEAALKKIQSATNPDIATLKRVLRFLLPTVGTSLSSSSLLSLLCLDWTNAELSLNLEFESLWKAELTSSDIILFFCDCFELSPGDNVNLADVEGLVISAMRHVESLKRQQVPGRIRLLEIVNRVLESGRTVDWVSKHGGNIARVLESGPSQELLERCCSRNDELQRNRNTEATHKAQIEKEDEELPPWMRRDDYDDSDHYGDYDDHAYDSEPMKDLTACDKECGYCGNCDY